MCVPIIGFQKDCKQCRAAEDWMKGYAIEEASEGVSPPGGEV